MLPAGGQGALAIQAKKSNSTLIDLISRINNKETQIRVKCERAFLRELGASCSTPVSVHAQIKENKLNLTTIIFDYDGSEIFTTKSSCDAIFEEGLKLGIAAANKTKKEAAELLQRICS